MDAQKCKVCGERHMMSEPHRFAPNRQLTVEELGGPFVEIVRETAKLVTLRPKFDRNAYQRDLMRKRRAAAKLAKEGLA